MKRSAVVLIPLDEYRKACQVLSAIAKGNVLISANGEPMLNPRISEDFTISDLWQTAYDLKWEAEEE